MELKVLGGASQSSMRAISGRPVTLHYLKAGSTALEDGEKAYELRQRELVDAVNDGKACPGLRDGCK